MKPKGKNNVVRASKPTVASSPSPRKAKTGIDVVTGIDAMERHQMIATAAYFRALERGFEPGHAEEDWLAAERDIAGAQSSLH